jgi:hypothetical protein
MIQSMDWTFVGAIEEVWYVPLVVVDLEGIYIQLNVLYFLTKPPGGIVWL